MLRCSRFVFVTLCLLGGCALPAPADADPAGSASLRLEDLDGGEHRPLRVQGDDVHVLLLTSHECPIANAYAPRLRRLVAGWRDQPRVRWFAVHVDPSLTIGQAREHAEAYELPGPILLDPGQRCALATGAVVTPEAVVLTAAGVAYRGRIDDQWRALGSRQNRPSNDDLADAVANALAGRSTDRPWPAAVGCRLPERAR